MTRGQAERLWPMIEAMLARGGVGYGDIDAIGVGIGPGSFTGIRLGVSAARGLALAIGKPAIGVSMFAVMAHGRTEGEMLISLPGPVGSAYIQRFREQHAQGEAHQIAPENPPTDLHGFNGIEVIGWRAETIARQIAASFQDAAPVDIPATIARIALTRLKNGGDGSRPAPLYVRAADAAPSRLTPPPRIG